MFSLQHFIFLLILSILVGVVATNKVMGFWGGFLWSLFLSPFIGIVIVLASKSKKQKQLEQIALLNTENLGLSNNHPSLIKELEVAQNLKEKNFLTEEEYQEARQKIFEKWKE